MNKIGVERINALTDGDCRMRIASYNIRKAIGLDWKRKPERILAVLSEMNADVIVLQEADKRFGKTRAGVLSSQSLEAMRYSIADVAIRSQSSGWHGNAIFYKSNLQLISCQRLLLPCHKFEPRGAVMAVFYDSISDRNFGIIGGHFSLLDTMRYRQITSIFSLIESRKDIPFIIGGDFNDRQVIEFPDFSDEFDCIEPGKSFHSSKPMFNLDKFIVSSSINVAESKVHISELSKKASDHLPIYIDIEL